MTVANRKRSTRPHARDVDRATIREFSANRPSPRSGLIFGCPTCFYAWRSSEPEENVNPDKYPAAFRLRPDGLADLKTVPPVRSPRRSAK